MCHTYGVIVSIGEQIIREENTENREHSYIQQGITADINERSWVQYQQQNTEITSKF